MSTQYSSSEIDSGDPSDSAYRNSIDRRHVRLGRAFAAVSGIGCLVAAAALVMALAAAFANPTSLMDPSGVTVVASVLRVIAGVSVGVGFVAGVLAFGYLHAYPEAKFRWLPWSVIMATAIALLLQFARAFSESGLR